MKKQLNEAMSFADLFSRSEPKRVVRSQTVTGPPLDIRAFDDAQYHMFNFKANPSTTGLRHHGYIKFKRPGRDTPLTQVPCVVDCTCFAGDTLVLMGDGTYRPIKDIVPGDTVYTHKGHVKTVTKNTERPLEPNEKTFQVSVSGFPGSFIVTGDHPFYTLRGNDTCRCGCGEPFENIRHDNFHPDRQLSRRFKVGHHPSSDRVTNDVITQIQDDLSLGQSIKSLAIKYRLAKTTIGNIKSGQLRPLAILENEEPWKWVKVKDFREREWFLTPWLEGPSRTNSLEPHLARLLGYYTADGCIKRRTDGRTLRLDGTPTLKSLAFCFHENERGTLVDDVVWIAEKLFSTGLTRLPQLNSRRPDNQEGPSYVTKNKTKSFDVIVYAGPALIDLVIQHIGEGSLEKKLSPWMMAMTDAAAIQFLTGLFLGDGHVCRVNRKVRWTSSSLTLVYQVSSLLNRLKVGHNITKIGNKETAVGECGLAIDIICGQPTRTVVNWMLPYLRANDVLTDFSDNRLDYSRPEGRIRSLMEHREVDFSGSVWDLTVDGDESFLIHGISVHNCPDYRFRYGWANKQKGAGKVGPGSMNQAWNKAPKITNPTGTPGLCKHILALKEYIQDMMYDLPKTGLKSSEDVLSRLVSYANKRWSDFPGQMRSARQRDARFQAMRSLQRAGVEVPNADELPPIPGETPEADEPPSAETTVEEPDLPNTPEEAEQVEPPQLHITPIKRMTHRKKPPQPPRRRQNRRGDVVDNLDTMTLAPLIAERRVILDLIEQEEAETPPTEGESAHDQALGLLRNIDQGIQTLGQGLDQLNTTLGDEGGEDMDGDGDIDVEGELVGDEDLELGDEEETDPTEFAGGPDMGDEEEDIEQRPPGRFGKRGPANREADILRDMDRMGAPR